jgi:hypothetical protein
VYYVDCYDKKYVEKVGWSFAGNGQSIFELDLSKVDDNIVSTFHSSDMLEITIEKIEPDTGIIQLLKLMGEPFLRLTPIMLQQGVSWGPIWDPIENLAFWYHEGMLDNLATLETNLSQIWER